MYNRMLLYPVKTCTFTNYLSLFILLKICWTKKFFGAPSLGAWTSIPASKSFWIRLCQPCSFLPRLATNAFDWCVQIQNERSINAVGNRSYFHNLIHKISSYWQWYTLFQSDCRTLWSSVSLEGKCLRFFCI